MATNKGSDHRVIIADLLGPIQIRALTNVVPIIVTMEYGDPLTLNLGPLRRDDLVFSAGVFGLCFVRLEIHYIPSSICITSS